jgi:hypothetical protein
MYSVLVSLIAAIWLYPVDAQHEIRVYNACPFVVNVGALNGANKELPANGGFALNSWEVRSVTVPREWEGRFWGRTDCDSSGRCVTGDCGNRLECQGAGGAPPATLAEFRFDGWPGNLDYYDVSLVDGYNLPIQIKPINGYTKTSDGKYDCNTAGCYKDLNAICPSELAVKKGEWTVACKSACEAFQTDLYCCRGAHNTPQTCRAESFPKNYPKIFKEACPDAYSYAYDDQTSTFTCKGPNTGYLITFCP